jgi:hypothetical protein
VALNDFELQYTPPLVAAPANTVINAQSNALPLLDVQSIAGFDLPDFEVDIDNTDGQQGGFVNADYLGPRLWVIDAIAYADPASGTLSMDQYLDVLRGLYQPVSLATILAGATPHRARGNNGTLQYKLPNIALRQSWCKPVGFKYTWDQGRRISAVPVQIQLQASDPRVYDPVGAQPALTVNGAATVINNAGTTNTYGLVSFTLSGTSTQPITISRSLPAPQATLTLATGLAAGTYQIDFQRRRLYDTTAFNDFTSFMSGTWWDIQPGSNSVAMATSGLAPTGVTIFYASAWL